MHFSASIRFSGILLALVALPCVASAQTISVDTDNDVVDFGGAQRVADLPGPDGRISLPEAGLASDNTPGVQTIGFRIPQSEWDYQQFFPGRAVLRPFLGFRVFDTVILDGTTQTAFTGETNPTGGAEVVIWQESYLIDNFGGAAFGFDNSSFHLSGGAGNALWGNTESGFEVFDSHGNRIGGAQPGEGNTGGFIQIDRANDNVVIGNTVLRVRVLGWAANGQPATNNRIGGPLPGERNFIIGQGTWSSEGYPGGFAIQIFDADGTVIENNQIGTTPDGMEQGHLATTSGIFFDGEHHDTLIRGNRIAGILGRGIGPHFTGVVGSGISVYGTGSGVTIVGNAIGFDALEQPRLGSVTGIVTSNYYLGPVQDVRIGGAAAGDGNRIAGHLGNGITVANTYAGMRIARNSIYGNGALGIDLIPPSFQIGVTPNDPGDADVGGNGLQNFPVLSGAFRTGGTLTLRGTLDSAPLRNYAVEWFATSTCDGSGHGEGELFVGATTVTTDAGGSAAFTSASSVPVPAGWVVTATATDALTGDTSEFSACAPVTEGLALTAGPLQRGQSVALTAQNALPQERVEFLLSLRGAGSGPCPPALGGLCLDLLPPLLRIGNATADAHGDAVLLVAVPPNAPLLTAHLQAVVLRGPGGADSMKSNVVSTPILP